MRIRINIYRLLTALFGVFLVTASGYAQPAGYGFFKEITLNTTETFGTNNNFPVLISVTDTDLRDNVENSNGFDIIFSDDAAGSNILDHQIESYNSTTGEYVAWVKKPVVSDANNILYMWYGNSSVSSDPSTTQTFSENYDMVFHFNNTFNDATPNGNNGVNNGSTNATGKIGDARTFDGTNDYIAIQNFNYNSNSLPSVTVAYWIKTNDEGNQVIMSYDRNEYWRAEINGNGGGNGEIGWDVLTDNGQVDFGSNIRVDDGNWHYVVSTYNNGTLRIYIDGVQNVTNNGGTNNYGTNNTRFGFIGVGSEANAFDGNKGPNNYMNGELDEISVSNVERSSDWIITSYNNQNNPVSYLSFGPQQEPAPVLQTASVISDTLKLVYDRNLDASSVPAGSDFTVNVNSGTSSVSNVLISGTQVSLVLSPEVFFGDNVQLDYTAGTNPIENNSGAAASNLSNQSVTNNTLDNTPPTAPQNVSAVAMAGGDIEITFDDVDEATGSGVVSYSIKRSTTSGGTYSEVGTVIDNESISYSFTDNSPVNGSTYYYVITAIDGSGNESVASSEVSATSDGTSPQLDSAVVAGDQLTLYYDEQLDISSAPANGDFDVTIDVNNVSVSSLTISGQNVILTLATSANVGDAAEIDYTPNVNRIRDLVGNQAAAITNQSVTNNTLGFVPTPPQDVTATAVDGGNIEISFLDVGNGSDIASYSVKRSTTSGGSYSQVGTVTDNNSANYTFTDNTAVDGTEYFYVVTSVDGSSNQSSNSDETSAVSDGTAPAYEISISDGSFLLIDFDELLNTSSVPTPGAFDVRVNGNSVTVSSVDVNNVRVTLELASAIQQGDNVTFDYTVPASNRIEDIAGNDAAAISNNTADNVTFAIGAFGPDPCPIVNGNDASWACFDGTNNGTSMTAKVGNLDIATVTSASGSQTTFAPNALQEWSSGAFSGDEFNGPQINATGASGDATSFDINIPSNVPSDAIIISLNRLRPDGGATTYTLEAFDGANQKVDLNQWTFGQGQDGGICTNGVNLTFANAAETIQFKPQGSTNPSCSSSSIATWFRIGNLGVERIEIRKVSSNPDNIHLGIAIVADYGDAPNSYRTRYNSRGSAPAFHLLSNTGTNPVFFGAGVDGDGNGASNTQANGDDTESTGIGSGDDEDAISQIPILRTNDQTYQVELVCTSGAKVGGWIDTNQNGSFDNSEYAFGDCISGSVTLNWGGLTGLITGDTFARFRIASTTNAVASPYGFAVGGEVEDYTISIQDPATPDLEIVKTVDNSTPIEGETVTFTVSVTNPGEFPATGIQVTDQLPNGLTYQSHTASQGSYNNSTNIWNIGSIADGDTTTVTLNITATVNSGTLGSTIINTAEITALEENDPELNNNSDAAGITVIQPQADIQITKIVDNASPIEGDFINYTISITNQGPRNATNLKITDQLPSGVTYQSATPSVGTYNNSTGIWDIGTFVNGANASLVINVRVDQGTEGNTISNTAALQSVTQNDPNSGNNSSTASITVAEPNAPVACSDRPSLTFDNFSLLSGTAGQVGAIYRYLGVAPGVNAEIEIITNSNATLVNFDQVSTGTAQNFQPQVEAVNKNLAEAYIDFEVRFLDSLTGNQKFLSFAATAVDVDGDNVETREFAGFQRLNSFTVESTTNLIVGSSGIFTTFESATTQVVNGIDPDDTENIAYSTYTNEPKFRIRAGLKDPTNTTGGSAQRQFSFNFNPCLIENFDNPTSQNIVELGVQKVVDNNNPSVADTVTYTITAINNQGNSVGNIEVTDQIPSGLTFVSATPSVGTYTSGTGVWDIGTFTGLQSATLVLKAAVNSGQEGNTITNTASFTDFSGTDGNINNNTSSADIFVFDPGSGLTCNEPPLFNFSTNTLESGVGGQVNAVYRFTNIGQGLDALVKIKQLSNAVLNNIDDNGVANSASNFSPLFTATQNGGFIQWEVKFVQAGTTTPVKKSFSMTALDIDGFIPQQGQSVQDFLGFSQNQSNTVQSGNDIIETTQGVLQVFTDKDTTDAGGSFDIDHMAYIQYNYTSVLEFRTGSNTTGGYQDDRLVDIDFTQCRNQDFTNPVVTTRNANISVSKTVDNANPLAGENVNFTVTVTNSGPENATELDVNETLPTGLTLVQATPSQGIYNQLTKTWAIGTLNNGSSVTLDVEATVDNGVTADSLVNKAFVIGLNQFDPSAANDTAKAAVYVSKKVEGVVFRDKTGNGITDGDTNFSDAAGDQQAQKDVVVYLFKDGGDGLADGNDDVYLQSDTTDISGGYSFQIAEEADYWISVNSKTGALSNGNTWAEQVYAPAGAICSDGTGSTTVKGSAGNCFGGRRGNQSDNLPTSGNPAPSDLANAEHVAKFTLAGSSISGINFGFSFNVVTDTRDGDDDGSAGRSIQGSLRQFITNANEISGANSMRFVPSVATNTSGSGGNWWQIALNSELPSITDALTTLDGRAYNLNAPITLLDPNSGTVGTGGSIGTDNISLNTFSRKELEINLNDVGNNALQINSSGAVVVRHFALYNNNRAFQVSNITGGTIENNLIGARADGTDPAGALQLDYGVFVAGSSSMTPLIQKNYLAFTQNSGIRSENANANIQFSQNEVYRTGRNNNNADGLEGIGTWTITQNLFHENGKPSGSDVYGGSGIEIGNNTGTLSSNSTIRNNTIRDNVTTGINVLNQVSSTLIEKNKITGNGTDYGSAPYKGAGVRLSFPDAQPQQGIFITKNSFSNNNGLAIDIVTSGNGEADGVSPNDGVIEPATTEPNRGLDYPVFTLATIDGNQLTVEGYIGKNLNRISGNYTIEIYKAANDGNQDGLIEEGGSLVRAHGEGQTLIGTITTSSNGTFSETFTISGASIVVNDRITALTFDSNNNTSEFSSNQRVVNTGVTVNGYVFNDVNHNSFREASEAGIENVTVVLYDRQLNNCKSVLTDNNGFYQFSNILNGQYDLIESFGQSVPTPDVCTPAENDPDDFVSTTPNLRTVTINNIPVQQNFGDFEGSKIQGKVFNDNGISGGTANDGIQNGGEAGLDLVIVRALTSSNTLINEASTLGDGSYTLYVPKSTVGDGGTIKIKEIDKTAFITTGGAVGTTSGTYDINTDEVSFSNTVGTSYTGVNFGDVANSVLLTDGNQTLLPGATALFQHSYEAKTAGNVTFTTSSVNNPSNATWPILLYQDTNCNGSIDSGEPILDGNSPIAVTANQNICLLLRVTVPQGVNNGASSNTTITATLDFANTSPTIQQAASRNDVVNVSDEEAGLVLIKTVDKAQALPGSILTYSISYQNNGNDPISSLEITDNTPTYTTFMSAACGALPNNLTACSINDPGTGGAGGINWTFTGTLQPGGSGVVTFTVKIDN